MQANMLPVGGAIVGGVIGTVIGGPLGLIAGTKVGAITAVAGGTAGVVGGGYIGYQRGKSLENAAQQMMDTRHRVSDRQDEPKKVK